MFGLGIQELMIVGAVAVILFGKRLPEVARSLGGTYRDFRRSLQEIQTQFDLTDTIYRSPSTNGRSSAASDDPSEYGDEYDQPTAPQFQLPPASRSTPEVREGSMPEAREAASEPAEDAVN